MSWYNKEHITQLDTTQIEGAFFLHGDLIARGVKALIQDTTYWWSEGMKSPMIAFPSGEVLPVEWDGQGIPLIHLFPGMDLPLFDTFERGVKRAGEQIKDSWFSLFGKGDTQLEVWSHQTEEVFFVIYDNEVGRIADVIIGAA